MMRRSSIFIIALNDLFFLLIIIATISFETSHCTTTNDSEKTPIICPEIEKQALLSFKHSLKDPNNRLSSWNDEANCCTWRGVVCSNSSGHVRELHLQGNYYGDGLRGEINSSLLNLKYLNYLNLSRNDFGETIPSFIGSLVGMEYLDLSVAGFHGAIPRTIGNLSNLRALNLRSTIDEFPVFASSEFAEPEFERSETYSDDLDWLSGLSKLEKLDMSFVNLSKVSNGLHAFNALSSLSELLLKECGLDLPTTSIDVANLSSLHTLDLSGNHFSSLSFPRWTLQLRGLTHLDLSSNSIEGPIPIPSNITSLEIIILSENLLNSTIPSDILNLSSLVHLDLSDNNLNGNLPPGVWRSCNILFLDLSGNKLKGEISDVIGNMSDCFMRDLRYLSLSANQFSGHLSERLGNFKNLWELHLGANSISGVIPFVLGEVSSLRLFVLSENKFNGNLPESIGRLSNLEWFDVSNNLLEGVVTKSHFIDMKNLSSFDASRNHKLTFELSSNWIPPFQLSVIVLHSTNLTGPFPSWLETQKYIYLLDLSNCGIYGLVPNWVWSIRRLNLSHNGLYGNIPDLNSVNEEIYLSSNQFSGPLPRIAATSLLFRLDLSNNSISGGISDAICDRNSTTDFYTLEFLHLGGNRLSGELPDCWTRMPIIRVLNLGDNDLYGSIPSSIELLTHLQTLNLRNNRISGSIPSSILNSRDLVNLDLSGNYFSGNLPEWKKSNSVNLRIIILRSNMLRGRIDPDICFFTSLQILDLSHNGLYGTIPRCFHNFTAMVWNHPKMFPTYYFPGGSIIGSADIMTKGYQRQYDVLLPLVTSIDLSSNSLSGNIPPEFTRLVNLRMLNLSRNRLTDPIPSDIGNMKQLDSLDLSVNSLTGEIPDSFTMMTFLSYLNLSYNELTGRIPESTQLQSMNASSFIGNSLCGPPLTIKCVNDDDHRDNDAIASHKADVDWFVVLFSLGFTIGLASFLVMIIFKKSLREDYFEMLDDVWEKILSSRLNVIKHFI